MNCKHGTVTSRTLGRIRRSLTSWLRCVTVYIVVLASGLPLHPCPGGTSHECEGRLQATLTRTLRLHDLVLLGVGTIIGSGIFIVPGAVLQQVDASLGGAAIVWSIAGILSLMGALTYAELGAMNPEAGGVYVYLRDAYGRLPSFLYGWTLFFVISSGSIAALSAAFTIYLTELVTLTPLARRLVPVLMIVVLAAINVRGTRHGANFQNWTAIVKVAAIMTMAVALLSLGRGLVDSTAQVWPQTISLSWISAVGVAMIAALWAYEGWQYVSFCAGDTLDPQRTFPRGIVIGIAVTIGVYLTVNAGYIAALGSGGAAQSERVATAAVGAVMGPAARQIIAVAVLASVLGAANGVTLSAPRVYFAMAKDGLFFGKLAEIHPRFGTPAVAIVASSAWAIVLTVTGTFEQLLTYVISIGWIFYALGGASIFVFRRRLPDLPRPFRLPGYPWTAVFFVTTAAAIVLNALATQPLRMLVGVVVVTTGAPAFYLWNARAKKQNAGTIAS